jgi:hypothetical protein
MGASNAIYVILTPGIVWDWKFGSHPDSSAELSPTRRPY